MDNFKHFLNHKTYDLNHLAKLHNVDVKELENQLTMGIEVEKEHTSHEDVAKEIALDHLREKPNYYTLLKKVEE